MKKLIGKTIRAVFGSAGYAIFNTNTHYSHDGLFTLHGDHFRRDEAFRAAYARGIKASNGFDPQIEWRVHVALWAASIAARVTGDFVECGVNAGFVSSAIMQSLDWRNSGRQFYLIDTFSGPVLSQYSPPEIERGREVSARAAIAAGAYVTDLDRIRANFSEWPNAQVVQGAVPDVLQTLTFGEVAFLHLDMNCALPERAALEFFWSRLPSGGVVLLDDYTYAGYESQTEAIDSVSTIFGFRTLALPTGQGLIIKR
jgi:hypothetical protein